VRIGLLGPVTAGPDGVPAPGGVMLRGALARLALDAGRSVATDVLVDALWGTEPPDTVTNALQALVARLRRALDEFKVNGIATTVGLHKRLAQLDDVQAARFDTGFLERLLGT